MKSDRLERHTIALLGIGHTNAHVVRMWGKQPIPDTRLVCISDSPIATYSGMLPAVLAGELEPSDMQIDLLRLCGKAGAMLIVESPIGLDRQRKEIVFSDRPPLPFDVLSIGIGSVTSKTGIELDPDWVISVKPMQTLMNRLQQRLKVLAQSTRQKCIQVAVVGGGAASLELAFCLPSLLNQYLPKSRWKISIVTRDQQIGAGLNGRAKKRIERELARRQIEVVPEADVVRAQAGQLHCSDARSLPTDLAIWATGAAPPALLNHLSLPHDDRGFLTTDQTLRVVSGDPIFVVGDSGSIVGQSVPKSGVYAVRQGPVLWRNLQNQLHDRPLERYQPQRGFLKLLNLGNGQAIGQWKGFSFQGRWVNRLKHHIDGQFMAMYQPDGMLMMNAEFDVEAMPCRGCGCKLDAGSLNRGLMSLPSTEQPSQRDDAVLVGQEGHGQLVSTDFFSLPFTDAYLSGRVTALHCSSDLLASGAKVESAIANVVVPEGDSRQQERWLQDFLAGASREFTRMSAMIVGGHTVTGPRAEAGFTVMAPPPQQVWKKDSLQVGDQLVLTKPLGIGVLLAAAMRGNCPGHVFQSAVDCMLENPFELVERLSGHRIAAATDVTGFGLAGHLLEMLDASDLSAELALESVPYLPGVETILQSGLHSTMAPANKKMASRIQCDRSSLRSWQYDLLFDPQTCGGFLFGVSSDDLDWLLAECLASGVHHAVRIGEVVPNQTRKRLLVW